MSFLHDGLGTLITFTEDSDVLLREKTVTPPGVDGGGAIDVTGMHNVSVRTQLPKALYTATPISFVSAYDPAVLPEILALVNVNGEITIEFPDGETWVVWGWLNQFQPQEHAEGQEPLANCSIEMSNVDAAGAEIEPVFSPAPV